VETNSLTQALYRHGSASQSLDKIVQQTKSKTNQHTQNTQATLVDPTKKRSGLGPGTTHHTGQATG